MGDNLTEAEQVARLDRYRSGMTDAQIGAPEGIHRSLIREWRLRFGLPANRPSGGQYSPDHEARLEHYRRGLTDREIAAAVGLTHEGIQKWRIRLKLPPNIGLAGRVGFNLTPEQHAARLLLYQMHYSDGRIAREQGVGSERIHRWRKRNGLPAHGVNRIGLRQSRKHDTTLDRIKAAIGRSLPPDLRDDAVANLYLAVLDGTVDLDRIEKEARRFGNRVIGDYASKFGPRSLDEELGDDDGFRMIDMIRDDRSSSWLEEMGATVW